MPRIPFDSSPQISSGLSLLFIFVLSMLVGWLTIVSSENVVQNFKESTLVKIEKRGVSATGVDIRN